jgi:hypothetical protein
VVAVGGAGEFLSVGPKVDFAHEAGLTIVAALNDVLRHAREVQAEKACHELSRAEGVERASRIGLINGSGAPLVEGLEMNLTPLRWMSPCCYGMRLLLRTVNGAARPLSGAAPVASYSPT